MTVTASPASLTALGTPHRGRARDLMIDDMCWRRAFPGLPAEARRARDFVRFLVEGCPRADDMALTAAELINNAVRHTRSGLPGGSFTVEVRRGRGETALTVVDRGGPHEPRARSLADSADPLELAESGRGLLTVGLTASRWYWSGGPAGRAVTAVFTAG